MKKNIIIIIIIVLVLLIGVLFLITLLDAPKQFRNGTEVEITDNEEIINLIKNAYYEDGSIFCEFVEPGDDWMPEEKNHTYLKEGKIFVEVTGDEYEDYYVIVKDGTVYIWSLEEESGLKFSITEYETLGFSFLTILKNPEAFEKSLADYQTKCKQIDIDDSLFKLPEDISFQDFGKMFLPDMKEWGLDPAE